MELSGACSLDLIVQPGGPTKPLLRKALRDKGAAETIWSAPKRGFNNPLSGLLRGALRPLSETIFENSPDLFAPWLRPDAVRALWREHANLKRNHAYALWPLLTFALWRSELEGVTLSS